MTVEPLPIVPREPWILRHTWLPGVASLRREIQQLQALTAIMESLRRIEDRLNERE